MLVQLHITEFVMVSHLGFVADPGYFPRLACKIASFNIFCLLSFFKSDTSCFFADIFSISLQLYGIGKLGWFQSAKSMMSPYLSALYVQIGNRSAEPDRLPPRALALEHFLRDSYVQAGTF